MTPEGATLVLVHGAGRDSRGELLQTWPPVLRSVLGENWTVVVPEMPNPDAPEAEAWIKAIAQAVAAYPGKVCLAGHSLGGSVALQYLARAMPGKCHAFIVAAPFWCGADDEWQYPPFSLTDGDIDALRSCGLFFYHGMADEVVPVSHLSEYQRVFPHAPAKTYKGMSHMNPSRLFLHDLATDVAAC